MLKKDIRNRTKQAKDERPNDKCAEIEILWDRHIVGMHKKKKQDV